MKGGGYSKAKSLPKELGDICRSMVRKFIESYEDLERAEAEWKASVAIEDEAVTARHYWLKLFKEQEAAGFFGVPSEVGNGLLHR